MRPNRKLRDLNVWQQGIQRHRAAARCGGAAHGGWARAFFRRLLGRRSAAPKESTPSGSTPNVAGAQAVPAGAPQGRARPELREGMLSRRAITMPGQTGSPPKIARADAFNIAHCRDVRIWQHGREFVAAACDGFDTGAGPEHALQRRTYWRQRSLRRSATAAAGSASKAAQAMRLLLRALAARQTPDDAAQWVPVASMGTAAPGTVNLGGRSRKTANKHVPQPVAAADQREVSAITSSASKD